LSVLRSILAVLAGVVFVVAASIGTDLALEHSILPAMSTAQASPALLALALAYRTLYGVIGGWIAAKLAPNRPMTHAIVLGAIGTAAALAGVIAEWKAGNQWYPIALVVLALPQSWLGAKLAARRA
jgi:hypothetical protein